MDCFASLAMTASGMFILLLLLLLLLLLACVDHPALGKRNRFAQHVEIADVIGENKNQRRIEIGALLVGQSVMRLDDGAKRVVRLGKIRAGGQCHFKTSIVTCRTR